MRAIKFRGRRRDYPIWIYGDLRHFRDRQSGKTYAHGIFCGNGFGGYEIVRPETIGQFTGRKDRNGIEIYVGDIIDLYDGECGNPNGLCGARLEVAFDEDEARYTLTNRVEGQEYTSGFDGSWKENIYVVIGNIHDNPSLLKGGGQSESDSDGPE